MNPNECPCCDSGVISSWRVNATNETILICDECDSVWEDPAELPCPAATTADQFLSVRGLPLLRSGLVPVA
ncbi:hypothetical protein [Kocuria arenosa]|uniref:hypothetical protein n=1 Tax=Kocuria arenosa TaxID=3071446 RepID=UPI0034D5DF81